ncbi:hypothetical protein H2248_000618 [Termitomyces sp. 'cryptogamus']|nr:hypothetical protein H2248_000612 [Termitomyces sp. 'cryptogamus']KAH0590469.1 hypothetical protein H2248_000618 [Termitomyces sp. 'cryptogamus']
MLSIRCSHGATDLPILVIEISFLVRFSRFDVPQVSSPHFTSSVFAAHPYHALHQHVCLDERERQRQRLVKLFLIIRFLLFALHSSFKQPISAGILQDCQRWMGCCGQRRAPNDRCTRTYQGSSEDGSGTI